MTKLSTNSDLSMDSIYKKEDKQVKLVTLRGNKLLVSEPGYLGHPTKQIPTPQNNFQPKKCPMLPTPIFQTIKAFTPVGLSQRKYFSTTAAPMLHPKNHFPSKNNFLYTKKHRISYRSSLLEACCKKYVSKSCFLK